jgi:1-deoxy-D-xylulose-5-phosphate reductoisomerase
MKILVLGATGSIGKQTIDVINKLKYHLCGISFYSDSINASRIKTSYKFSPINKKMSNVTSYDELIIKSKPDIVVNAIVGFAGLEATLAVIRHKKTLCLANKESLVVAGQFVMKLAKRNHVHVYPIDSEHASLYQIIKQYPGENFQKLYITASGGPFYKLNQQQKSKVTYAVATNHPT